MKEFYVFNDLFFCPDDVISIEPPTQNIDFGDSTKYFCITLSNKKKYVFSYESKEKAHEACRDFMRAFYHQDVLWPKKDGEFATLTRFNHKI